MPIRSALATLVVAALSACSPATNTSPEAGADISQLVGTWIGTSTITSGTHSGSVTAMLNVRAGALGLITLDICPDQSLLSATVTSPTAFTLMVPATCPAGAVNGCASAALTYTSGSGGIGLAPGIPIGDGGTFDGGAASDGGGPLQFTAAGTLAGCQQSSPVSVTFTGTRQ